MGKKLVGEFLSEVSRIFSKLDAELFENRIPTPAFRWNPQKKYSIRFEVGEDGDEMIVVGAGARDETQTGITICIIREMIHLDHHYKHIIGRTSNQYHNRKFMFSALKLGFGVDRGAKGWSELRIDRGKLPEKSPDASAARRLDAILASFTFDESVLASLKDRPSERKARKFQYKFICNCPPPYNSIRSGRRPEHARALNAMCLDCGATFRFIP